MIIHHYFIHYISLFHSSTSFIALVFEIKFNIFKTPFNVFYFKSFSSSLFRIYFYYKCILLQMPYPVYLVQQQFIPIPHYFSQFHFFSYSQSFFYFRSFNCVFTPFFHSLSLFFYANPLLHFLSSHRLISLILNFQFFTLGFHYYSHLYYIHLILPLLTHSQFSYFLYYFQPSTNNYLLILQNQDQMIDSQKNKVDMELAYIRSTDNKKSRKTVSAICFILFLFQYIQISLLIATSLTLVCGFGWINDKYWQLISYPGIVYQMVLVLVEVLIWVSSAREWLKYWWGTKTMTKIRRGMSLIVFFAHCVPGAFVIINRFQVDQYNQQINLIGWKIQSSPKYFVEFMCVFSVLGSLGVLVAIWRRLYNYGRTK